MIDDSNGGLSATALLQIESVVDKVVAKHLSNVGIHTGSEEKVDEARADFLFVRKVRKLFDEAANKVMLVLVITALVVMISAVDLSKVIPKLFR